MDDHHETNPRALTDRAHDFLDLARAEWGQVQPAVIGVGYALLALEERLAHVASLLEGRDIAAHRDDTTSPYQRP